MITVEPKDIERSRPQEAIESVLSAQSQRAQLIGVIEFQLTKAAFRLLTEIRNLVTVIVFLVAREYLVPRPRLEAFQPIRQFKRQILRDIRKPERPNHVQQHEPPRWIRPPIVRHFIRKRNLLRGRYGASRRMFFYGR